jgi:hypothetical protein
LSQLYAVYNSVNIPACNGPAINFIKTLVAVQYGDFKKTNTQLAV